MNHHLWILAYLSLISRFKISETANRNYKKKKKLKSHHHLISREILSRAKHYRREHKWQNQSLCIKMCRGRERWVPVSEGVGEFRRRRALRRRERIFRNHFSRFSWERRIKRKLSATVNGSDDGGSMNNIIQFT